MNSGIMRNTDLSQRFWTWLSWKMGKKAEMGTLI